MSDYYLVGDVGGTKTDLAVYSSKDDTRKYVTKQRFQTADYPSLENLIATFLENNQLIIKEGILSVAGPVLNDRVTFSSSNLPWEVERFKLINELNIPEISLINDLEAVAISIPFLKEDDLYTINQGIKEENKTLAIIAPGTGLGEAFLLWTGEKYQPCVSEGAHVNFGPRTETEMGLLRHCRKINRHVTYESLCSGLGIPSIYDYLKENSGLEEPSWISDLLKSADDKTPIILDAALQKERSCTIAQEALKLFVSILGAETGNLVLKTMATGGIYLGGGLPGKIIPFLDSEIFIEPYADKGIMAEMMLDVPIHIIINPDSAILGAADYLFHKNGELSSQSGLANPIGS
ncbi:MAG: glucokinase [Bacteroidetes bacterium]|nr:glucokinase [Bacteroidota bacterium]